MQNDNNKYDIKKAAAFCNTTEAYVAKYIEKN
jgi:hypothetical protein